MSEFQESLQQKDKTITELQRTVPECERNIQQREQGDTASRDIYMTTGASANTADGTGSNLSEGYQQDELEGGEECTKGND